MGYHKFFTMSFDDGLEQDKKIIQICNQYGIKCTFNLNAGLLGSQHRIGRIGNIGFLEYPEGTTGFRTLFPNHDHHRISANEIAQVYQGFEVASHGYRHEALAIIKPEQMEHSIRKDIQELSRLVGYPIVGHSYPGGSSSGKVAACLKKNGIIYGREIFPNGSFSFPKNPLRYRTTGLLIGNNLFKLVDQFIQAEPETDDLLFCIWGHGYELNFGTELCNWKRFEQFCEKIAGQKDIVYCTNKQAFELHMQKKP